MKKLLILLALSATSAFAALPSVNSFRPSNFNWTGTNMELQPSQQLGFLGLTNQGLQVYKVPGKTSYVYMAQLEMGGMWVDPRNYAAAGVNITDGTNDATAALQAAINIAQTTAGTVYIPRGSLRVTSPLIVTNEVHFRGSSKQSFIYSDLAAPGATIKVANGTNIVFKGSISLMGFYCNSNAVDKTCIELDDVSDFTISDIDIYPWTGSGTNNIGIYTKGRQFIYLERITGIADRAYLFGHNPNSYLSFDQSHVRDCGLQSNKGAPLYDFEDGVFLSDAIFEGTQSLNTSSTAFHYVNTTSALRSLKVKLANFRPEQAPSTNGYAIYINSPAGAIQGLTIENCSFPDDMPGLFLRNCQGVSIRDCQFYENGANGVTEQANFTAVDATNYCERVKFDNCFSQSGGTAVTTGMTMVERGWKSMGGNPLPESGTFLKLANNRYQVNSPLFLGAADVYAQDSNSNSVSAAYSLHHTYTGTTTIPNFGIGTALEVYSDVFGALDRWVGSPFRFIVINPTNSFYETFVLKDGSQFQEADWASDHITFYPAVFNVPNIVASSGINSPAVTVTGQLTNTLAYFSGSHTLISLSNGPGVPYNDGNGSITYTTHPVFYNDGTSLTLAPGVTNHSSLLTYIDDKVGSARGSLGFSANGDTNMTWNVNNGDAIISSPVKLKISATDTTPDFLETKLQPGANVTFTTNNIGGNETITIASLGGASGNTNYNFIAPITQVNTNVYIATNGISNTLIRQGAADSVIGRSANSFGNVADIAASADGQFLQRAGGVLTFAGLPGSYSGELILNTQNNGTDYIGGNPNASVFAMPNLGGTNAQITLPLAGTYRVEACYAIYGANIFSDYARFYNSTTAAVASPVFIGSVFAGTSQLYTKTISKLITTSTSNNVIQLQFASDDTTYGNRSLMDTLWITYIRLY